MAGKAKKPLQSMAAKVTDNVISELPMDEANRMVRATEMGHRTDTPVYHGSGSSFSAFDRLELRGQAAGARAGRQGAAWAFDPEVANEFAEMAGKAAPGSSPQVYQMYYRSKKEGVLELDGSELDHEIAATLENAFESGYDAVVPKNNTTPGGKTEKNIVAVRDPEQLRSRFPKFDPAKRSSSDLLAGLGGLGATGLLGLMMSQNGPTDRQEQ